MTTLREAKAAPGYFSSLSRHCMACGLWLRSTEDHARGTIQRASVEVKWWAHLECWDALTERVARRQYMDSK